MWLIILGVGAITLAKVINAIDNPKPMSPFETSPTVDRKMKRGKVYNRGMIFMQISLCCLGVALAFISSPIAGIIVLFYALLIMKSLRFALPRGYSKLIK
jgi:glucose uptake protein GlcU